jgi:hypothetical protein
MMHQSISVQVGHVYPDYLVVGQNVCGLYTLTSYDDAGTSWRDFSMIFQSCAM